MKKYIGWIICILLLVGLLGYIGYSTVNTLVGYATVSDTVDEALSSQGQGLSFVTGKVYYASPEYVKIKHSINFIPTGTEHFYLIYSTDGKSAITVKAADDWDKDYFQDFYNSKGVEITGQIKAMEYDVKRKLAEYLEYEDVNPVNVSYEYYIDTTAINKAWIGVGFFVTLILSCIGLYVIVRKNINNKVINSLTAISALAWLVFLLIYI